MSLAPGGCRAADELHPARVLRFKVYGGALTSDERRESCLLSSLFSNCR